MPAFTPQHRLYASVDRGDYHEVASALSDGARWDLDRFGQVQSDQFGRILIGQFLGYDSQFHTIPEDERVFSEQQELGILDQLLLHWPDCWPHWDGPLQGQMRLLHMYVYKDSREVVETLLIRGADPNAVEDDGRSALFCATSKKMVDLLIAAGADVYQTDFEGKIALDIHVDTIKAFPTSASKLNSALAVCAHLQALKVHPQIKPRLHDICVEYLNIFEDLPQMLYSVRKKKMLEFSDTYTAYRRSCRLEELAARQAPRRLGQSPNSRPKF